MNTSRKALLLAALLAAAVTATAQKKTRALHYWGNQDKYLETQTSVLLDFVDDMLDRHLPSVKPSEEREAALYLLDAVCHDTRLDRSEAARDYMERRIGKVVASLKQPMKRGLEVYKIYNDGFILRTRSTTVAVDLVSKSNHVELYSDSLTGQLVGLCDALFITHRHGDHADPLVARLFASQQKPVYCPSDFLPHDSRLHHVAPDKFLSEQLALRNSTIRLNILPGHQDELQCNHFVITFPEHITIAHIGDQDLPEDMDWIVKAHERVPKVDVMIVDCWARPLDKVVEGYRPKVVVTGHENELSHTIDHREAYWLTYYKMQEATRPYVIMSCGERYLYR
ncbi:MAG: MBL fold metallo-hydrolase [Prevotella sp.]|nr:MBL fold metallo-hydrolase [Prevotella sp.]